MLVFLLAQASVTSTADIKSDWINERRTALIRIAECPSGLCGTIIWSAPAARRDAARGGTADLNGVIVMFGFNPTSSQRWRGKLFLPDQNRTVKATIELRGDGQLHVKGCELGGLICRSQTWARWIAE